MTIKPLVITWTKTNALAAQKQGWGLFYCGGWYELQLCAGMDHFQSDDDVVTHCIKQAIAGDKVCAKALILCSLLDPHWMAADYSLQLQNKRITVRGMPRIESAPCSSVDYHTYPYKPEEK